MILTYGIFSSKRFRTFCKLLKYIAAQASFQVTNIVLIHSKIHPVITIRCSYPFQNYNKTITIIQYSIVSIKIL